MREVLIRPIQTGIRGWKELKSTAASWLSRSTICLP